MANADTPLKNGKGSIMLLFNTILTFILLPVVAFVGVRLWDKLDKVSEISIRTQEQVQFINQEITAGKSADRDLDMRIKKIEEQKNGKTP